MKKIAIIGHFGGNRDFLDGQTVKTKILYDELTKETDWNIQKIDTYWKNKRPVKLLASTIGALICKKDVIVLLSGNGMKMLFPILSFFARFWHVRVFHDVIGGNLDKYVVKIPKFKGYLRSFHVNWVETETLRKRLSESEIDNCEVIPNFKRLNIIDEKNAVVPRNEPYAFCTFSRVMKEKGIESAIEAIEKINRAHGRTVCRLDIYGVADPSYKERFEQVLEKSTDAIHYCGVVPYSKSVEVIAKYYALLFPTFWDGEGFPGTIVDAFFFFLLVIASDWNSNGEIIDDGKNGLLYPGKIAESLDEAIAYLIDRSDRMIDIKKQCILDAEKYQPDEYIKQIVRELEGNW